ncbi:hypothetical protein RCH21_000119 [Arthrobacter sp. PL16]|nr:hypothetical protein [Arthrobacter sp. PL16]
MVAAQTINWHHVGPAGRGRLLAASNGYTVQSRKRMSKSRKIWLGLLTGMVATAAAFSL